MTKEVWARCGDCGAEFTQNDKQCPKCGSIKKAYRKESSVKIGIAVSTRVQHKRKGKGTILDAIGNRWKRSGDPNLVDGVREYMVIDKVKDEYHHIVKDAKTGQITHEEHEPLSKHNKKEGQ